MEVEKTYTEMTTEELKKEVKRLEADLTRARNEASRYNSELANVTQELNANRKTIVLSKQLPYVVANVTEILDDCELEFNPERQATFRQRRAARATRAAERARERERLATAPRPSENVEEALAKLATEEERDAIEAADEGKCAVVKSRLFTRYVPSTGLLRAHELQPGDLVGIGRDSYMPLEKLPTEFDSRVKAMEVDERPSEDYSDIGGLDSQIQELIEAVVLPLTHPERFKALNIQPPKGILMHGPPGTGKTLMARACAAQCKAAFLKLAGSQLVQGYIGEGAKIVKDAFDLARKRGNAIIFIDEIDAVGQKRSDDENSSKEVQRTMLELLSQMDGFSTNDTVKVIAATNRPDTLDPALMRSGRFDRKIEFPHPNEAARAKILQIHSRKMKVSEDVNYAELARMTQDFNGAQLKAVCTEAGMLALRRDAVTLSHEDFVDGVAEVQAKKKKSLDYFA